jgi:hypothetical protein
MTSIEIIWYLGRIIADIRTVEEKIMNEGDVDMLRDMRVKLGKLRVNIIYSTLKIEHIQFFT